MPVQRFEPRGVRMPILLYEHLRLLCKDHFDKDDKLDEAIGLQPGCSRCEGIVRWAIEGREVEGDG